MITSSHSPEVPKNCLDCPAKDVCPAMSYSGIGGVTVRSVLSTRQPEAVEAVVDAMGTCPGPVKVAYDNRRPKGFGNPIKPYTDKLGSGEEYMYPHFISVQDRQRVLESVQPVATTAMLREKGFKVTTDYEEARITDVASLSDVTAIPRLVKSVMPDLLHHRRAS